MPQRPQVFKNVSRQHDIPFKIKIFAERYPFYWHNGALGMYD